MKQLFGGMIAAAALVSLTAAPSQATLWTFTEVQGPNQVDAGFGFSSAHDSSGGNVMAAGPAGTLVHFGATASNHPSTGDGEVFGTYDDVTGALSVIMFMFSGTGAN